MSHDLLLLVLIAATFVLAGMVKGVTGMGLPTVAMGLLGALLSPLTAAGLLLAPSFVTNLWQLVAGPNFRPLIGRLWPMIAGLVVGTIAGSSMLARGQGAGPTIALGVALTVYALYTLFARQVQVKPQWEVWLAPLVGLATGLITGGTGVLVIPAVPYLQALDFEKDELVQALGLSFTISTCALAAGLLWHDALPMREITTSALAIVPAMAGMALGQIIRSRISPQSFRRWFLICLVVLGLEMSLRPLFF